MELVCMQRTCDEMPHTVSNRHEGEACCVTVACVGACGCGVCARIMLNCPDARVSEKGGAGCVDPR